MNNAFVVASSLGLLVALGATPALGDDLRCRHVAQPGANGTSVTVLQCDHQPDYTGREIAAWTSGSTGVLLVGLGAVFQGIAIHQQNRINDSATMRDPATGLPTVAWTEVQSLESSRNLNQGLAIGCFVAGGIGIVLAATLWLLPRAPQRRDVAGLGAGRSSFALRPGGAGVTVSF